MPKFQVLVGGKTQTIYASHHDVTRKLMPYGLWRCQDGREVLFDRWYDPVCERRPGEAPKLANRAEWVRDIQHETWFYDDGTPDREKRAAAKKALTEWGMKDSVMAAIDAILKLETSRTPVSRATPSAA